MLRIAFIGTGGIARSHAKGLAQRSDVRFVGAFDIAPDRAQSFAAEYGGTAFDGMDEMLDTAKPDAVWICLPPFAHGEAEAAVLRRRLPFLVEKPVSNSLDAARRVLDQVEHAGTLTAVGYMNRYRCGINRELALLKSDPAVLAHGAWIGGTPGVPWWRVQAESGGQIVEQTTHTFDLARYLLGEPVLVFATGARGFVTELPNYDVADASAVSVQFESGAVASLVSSCANRSSGAGVHLTVVARNHVANFTGWEHDATIVKSGIERIEIKGEADIFAIEDDAFVQAVKTNDASLIRSSYADGLKTLVFCLASNQSLESGEPVLIASM